MQDVEIDLSNIDLSSQQGIRLQKIADSCREVFNEIDKARLKWEPNDVRDLRNRICSNISILNAFNGRITRDNVTALLKAKTNEQHQIYLDWLSPAVYATQQCDYISRRQPETGEWFLESPEFQTWLEKPQQTLFCPGIPGAGKTILSSVVIDELESRYGNNRDIGVAYIYCSFYRNDDRIQKPECLFASILRQLAQGLFPVPHIIQALYEKHRLKGTQPSVEEMSRALPLIAIHFSRLFIVIDALDECRFTAMSRVLNDIFCLQATHNVNLLATARFIPEIMTRFLGKPTKEIRGSKPDVMRYLRANLNKLPAFVSRNLQLQQEILIGITNAVDGMEEVTESY
ncbi:hypothetical protein EYZ11_012965 [Aspergillus tanneri]|uniref:Nephrocystin 3-like N-terminal domain-containing protein n=1 Tax=Aspergillus tanneri TaxID=1220188 RepID=A0A4S3IYV7_9EURO|nr:hypothetical protein EYZ11_012965 [Aspergillus tanneri]